MVAGDNEGDSWGGKEGGSRGGRGERGITRPLGGKPTGERGERVKEGGGGPARCCLTGRVFFIIMGHCRRHVGAV